MSDSEKWAGNPNYKEYMFPLFDPENELEIQVRVKLIKIPNGKRGKKKVDIFSVGLEVKVDGKWKAIVRHCNYHENTPRTFHTHNKVLLLCLGEKERIPKLNRKKTPASQLTWSIDNIKLNYQRYLQEYREKAKITV